MNQKEIKLLFLIREKYEKNLLLKYCISDDGFFPHFVFLRCETLNSISLFLKQQFIMNWIAQKSARSLDSVFSSQSPFKYIIDQV